MILSTGRQREGPTLWEKELSRTPFPPLARWWAGQGGGGGLWAVCKAFRGSLEQRVAAESRVWPFLVAGSIQTGQSFTVLQSVSLFLRREHKCVTHSSSTHITPTGTECSAGWWHCCLWRPQFHVQYLSVSQSPSLQLEKCRVELVG